MRIEVFKTQERDALRREVSRSATAWQNPLRCELRAKLSWANLRPSRLRDYVAIAPAALLLKKHLHLFLMQVPSTIDTEHLKAILVEQSRIALVNYDAAHKNHENLEKLLAIVVEQSHQVKVLVATVADLLVVLERS